MNTGSLPGIVVEETRSFRANGAITKFAVVCVSNSTTGDVALPASANDEYRVGVANYGVADNKTIEIVVKGTMEVVAGAVITVGQLLVINGTLGRVKTDPATASTTSHIIGRALTPADTAGDHLIMEILIFNVYNHA